MYFEQTANSDSVPTYQVSSMQFVADSYSRAIRLRRVIIDHPLHWT